MVWYGSAAGLGPNGDLTNYGWMARGNKTLTRLGWSVGTAGDVNGDGYADVIVGARDYDNGQTDEGGVFVWYGSADGIGREGTPANADRSAESDGDSAGCGYVVRRGGQWMGMRPPTGSLAASRRSGRR